MTYFETLDATHLEIKEDIPFDVYAGMQQNFYGNFSGCTNCKIRIKRVKEPNKNNLEFALGNSK